MAPAVGVDHRGMRIYVETSDWAVGLGTYRTEAPYEIDEMVYALQLVEQETGTSLAGRGFVDVGANIGTTVVPACKLFGATEALALEPSRRNVRQLKVNLAANDLDSCVQVVAAAVSDRPGTVELELSAVGNYGDNRVRVGDGRPGEWAEDRWATEMVEVVTLDDVMNLKDPAVLWIDTQGHEAQVLAGATTLAHVPTITEFWPYGLRRAGGLERFNSIVLGRYSKVIDIRRAKSEGRDHAAVPVTPAGLADLAARYPGARDYTDLVLIP